MTAIAHAADEAADRTDRIVGAVDNQRQATRTIGLAADSTAGIAGRLRHVAEQVVTDISATDKHTREIQGAIQALRARSRGTLRDQRYFPRPAALVRRLIESAAHAGYDAPRPRDWSDLPLMTDKPAILVTGGAGLSAATLSLPCGTRGWPVVVIDNLTTGFRWAVEEGAAFEQGDIGDIPFVEGVLARYDVKGIMHFAGSIIVPESVENPSNIIATIPPTAARSSRRP